MLLNYCTESEVEKLTEEITEVGRDIWGTHGNSYTSPSLHVRLQSQKGITDTLFIAVGRDDVHHFVGWGFISSKRITKV